MVYIQTFGNNKKKTLKISNEKKDDFFQNIPPKEILSVVTSIERLEFETHQQANVGSDNRGSIQGR